MTPLGGILLSLNPFIDATPVNEKSKCCYEFTMKTTLSVLQISLQGPSDVDLSNYVPHHAWDLHSTHAKRNVHLYHCCPAPYMDVTYQFVLRRRPGFFRDLYIIPALLMASLVPFTFALPVTHVHRYVLGEEFRLNHNSDAIMSVIATQITSISVLYSTVCSGARKKTSKLCDTGLCEGNPQVTPKWIPLTKGQQSGKCFHLMTSSCHHQCRQINQFQF